MTDAADAVGGGPDVVGRAAERDRIDAFAAALPEGPRALLIRGEPGIGKTTLWRYGVQLCRRAGFTVLVTRPAEEDLPLALGGLVDLFEHDELDAGTLRAQTGRFALGRAVLAALQRLADRQPTVVAIDDLQWLDSASARALRYALRRLGTAPIGLLATARPGADPHDAPTLASGANEVVDVGPLSPGALRRVLGRTVAAISRPTLRRIHEVSGGNPLFALELARGLAAGDPSYGSAGTLPLPESLQAAIDARLETVPADLMPVLETASALGPASVAELRQVLPEVDVDGLLALTREHDLLVVEENLEVRFSHPLVSSAVYGRMGQLHRRALHGKLAERTADPDVRARHLALSTDEADPVAAELLEEAAGRARSRGAFDVAAELARHSLRLTPAGTDDDALRRALAEIEDLARAGEVRRAVELSNRLVESLPSGAARAEALIQHSDLESHHPAVSVAFLERALEDAGEDEPLRARVLQELAFTRFLCFGDVAGALECARESLTIADALDDVALHVFAAACLAHFEAIAGRPQPDTMARTVEYEEKLGSSLLSWRPGVLDAKQRRWAGELHETRTLREVRGSSSENERPYRLYDLALVECAAGNFSIAEELVHKGIEAARDAGDGGAERSLLYPLALVEAWLGRAPEAREAAARQLERALRLGERLNVIGARRVLGLLALSEGDAQEAVRELMDAARLLGETGIGHPGLYPALPDGVEALARTGDVTSAAELLERLEQQAASVDSTWAFTAAQRSRGLLLLTQGKTEVAASLLAQAAASFDELEHRPDAARAVLARGQALVRSGQRTLAFETLADARRRFVDMGATLWEARTAEELERVAPGRRSGELTAAERRVAALVAQGRRNREIAQELFVGAATVEAHLTRIYAKLDIRSRSELARLVTERRVVVTEDEGQAGQV